MFIKKISPEILRSVRETTDAFQKEIDKVQHKIDNGTVTPDEYRYLEFVKHKQAEMILMGIEHINENVWFRKRFWKKMGNQLFAE